MSLRPPMKTVKEMKNTDTDILHAAHKGQEKPGVMMEMDEAQHLEEDGDDISRA